jgi:type I restriction enzyme S subunit
MIQDLRPYPYYKSSGLPWVGIVPEHWEVLPALVAYRPKRVKNTGMIENTVLSLSYGRIIVKPSEKLHGLVPESFETYQVVDPGDIIVRTMDLQNDQTSLRIGYSKYRGIITSAYMCLETRECVLNEFGYQFLNAYDLLKIIYGFGSGLRQNLEFSHIKRMPILVPPISEQSAIVGFINHMDRRIRRYIRAKQKLIKLLEEQKQAIIHRAVTRGLDPNVRLKPSGVEWLGDVPEHWEVRRLKHAFRRIVGGSTPSSAEPKYWDGDVVWVTPSDISRAERLKSSLRRITQEGLKSCSSELVPPGSIIVTSRAPVGNVALADVELCTNQGCKALVTTDQIMNPMFGFAVLRMLKGELQSLATGTTFTEISTSKLGIVPIPLPPLPEQSAIVRFLDEATAGLNYATNVAQREIDLLCEYRTRLVADAITGKVDVREVAEGLPNEPEEPEPLDDVEPTATGDEKSEGADRDVAPEEAEI